MSCIDIDITNPNDSGVLFEIGKNFTSVNEQRTVLIPAITPPSTWSVKTGVGVQLANQLEIQYVPYAAKYGIVKLYVYAVGALPTQITFSIYEEYNETADYTYFASRTPVFTHTFTPQAGFNLFACDTVVEARHMLSLNCKVGEEYEKEYWGGSLTNPAWFRRVVTPGYNTLGSFSSNSLFIFPESFENRNQTAVSYETVQVEALRSNYDYKRFVESLARNSFWVSNLKIQADQSMLENLLRKEFVYEKRTLSGSLEREPFKLKISSDSNGFVVDYQFKTPIEITNFQTLAIPIPADFQGMFTLCDSPKPSSGASQKETVISPKPKPIPIPEHEYESEVCCWPWLVLFAIAMIKMIKRTDE